jgi:hypothetical protein
MVRSRLGSGGDAGGDAPRAGCRGPVALHPVTAGGLGGGGGVRHELAGKAHGIGETAQQAIASVM